MKIANKFLVFIVFMGIISIQVSAQDKLDEFVKTFPQLDKYTGTWQWQSADSLLTIVLVKTQFNLKKSDPKAPDATFDVIIGWHELKVKNSVVESSMGSKSVEFDYSNRSQSISAKFHHKDNSYTRLPISYFRDLTTKISMGGYFELSATDMNMGEMVLHQRQYVANSKAPKPTYPNKMILKRVK